MFLWLLRGGFPTRVFLKSRVFNPFLLSLPEGETQVAKLQLTFLRISPVLPCSRSSTNTA